MSNSKSQINWSRVHFLDYDPFKKLAEEIFSDIFFSRSKNFELDTKFKYFTTNVYIYHRCLYEYTINLKTNL